MRIAMFVYNRCTTDQRVLKSAATLVEHGHELKIIAVKDATVTALERRGKLEIERIERNPLHYRVVRRLAPLQRSGASPPRAPAPDEGEPPSPVARPAWRNRARRVLFVVHKPLMYLDWYVRAGQAARTWDATAYHAHDLNTLPIAAWLACRMGGRLVYDAHELFHEMSTLSPFERRVWQMIERLLIGHVDTVITVNRSIAEELRVRYGIDAPLVVHNAPPARPSTTTGANLRQAAGLAPDDPRPIVLFHGGFTPYRGLEELVQAAALSRRYVLVLLGDGKLRPELERLVGSLELESRVRFVAPVAYDRLMELAGSADIGVIPYRPVGLNNFYSTPNKLFEYMQAGLAIVATSLPELRRIVEAHDIGTLFESVTPRAIADALEATLANPARLAALRANARSASRLFTWESESASMVKSYESGARAPMP